MNVPLVELASNLLVILEFYNKALNVVYLKKWTQNWNLIIPLSGTSKESEHNGLPLEIARPFLTKLSVYIFIVQHLGGMKV